MKRDVIMEKLEYIRLIQYRIWKEYRDKAKEDPFWTTLRDEYEIGVRALDYAMEALRHDAV